MSIIDGGNTNVSLQVSLEDLLYYIFCCLGNKQVGFTVHKQQEGLYVLSGVQLVCLGPWYAL